MGRRGTERELDGGSTTIEALILLPCVLLLSLLLVQWVLVWHGRHVAQAAAQTAAVTAAGYLSDQVQGEDACDEFLQAVAANLLPHTDCIVDRGTTTVIVTINATVLSVVPLVHPHITEVAHAQTESVHDGGP